MPEPSKTEKARQQVAELQRLEFPAGAWLVGMHPRTLKDHLDFPLGPDGTVDAQAALRWACARAPRPDLPDEAHELLLIAAETLLGQIASYRLLVSVRDALVTIVAAHGEAALNHFAIRLLEVLRRDTAGETLGTIDAAEAQADIKNAEVARQAREEARKSDSLLTYVQCPTCDRVRVGSTWKKRPPDAGRIVADYRVCPSCENKP